MKFTLLSSALFLASITAHTAAQVTLDTFPTSLQIGKTYTLNWNSTANYAYTIWLVLQNPGESEFPWIKLWTVATDLHFDSLEGHYDWVIPGNISTSSNHALYLAALMPSDGEYYSDTTDWFKVSQSAEQPSTTGSTSPTASATRTPNENSSDVPSSDHHSSPSGGAIAGIVIGILVGLAFVAGAAVLFVWRRKRSGVQKREAAARASRLAPVMERNAPSYEMHGTPPQEFKSSAV